MKISNLKDLQRVISLCRKQGVAIIKIDGMELHLGPTPFKPSNSPTIDTTSFPEASIKIPTFNGPIADVSPIKTEELTEDQLLFYSAQGHEQVEQ